MAEKHLWDQQKDQWLQKNPLHSITHGIRMKRHELSQTEPQQNQYYCQKLESLLLLLLLLLNNGIVETVANERRVYYLVSTSIVGISINISINNTVIEVSIFCVCAILEGILSITARRCCGLHP